MESKYSVEKKIEVHDDKTGAKIVIGSDPDGLGLVDARSFNDRGDMEVRVSYTVEQFELLCQYGPEIVADIRRLEGEEGES